MTPTTLHATARAQIKHWIHTTKIRQKDFGDQIGRNQVWVSRYLAGRHNASIETLQRMAAVFGHSIATLFGNLPTSDPTEARLLALFRGCRPQGRALLLSMAEEMTAQQPGPPRSRR